MKNLRHIHITLFFVLHLMANAQSYYKAERLTFNTLTYSEMAPAIIKEGLIFSSDQKNEILQGTTNSEGGFMYNLYYINHKGKKSWSNPEALSSVINNQLDQSSACFDTSGNEIYFTSTLINLNQNITGQLAVDSMINGIYSATKSGDSWQNIIPFPFNDPTYDMQSPNLNTDGNRLYFSARNPDGFGGYDIYYSDKINGAWQQPVNAGPKINTAENEVFPFIFNETRLYFSSRGHSGLGGVDIFYCDFINQEWTLPVNLPDPFNSTSDDFSFVAKVEMDTGYFTSNRRGSDDIFRFTSTLPVFPNSPQQIEETFCYKFFEEATTSLDTTSYRYEWDLGDGTKMPEIMVRHCYSIPGIYQVQLNVIDTLTNEVSYSVASYDLEIVPVEQPYITCADTLKVGDNVTFSGLQSTIRSFTINNYYWDFGDGGIEVGASVNHTFLNPGIYQVRLGVIGPADENNTVPKAGVTKSIVVMPVN